MGNHQKQWEFLKRKFEANQLSHAYLFTGSHGIGKKFFAKELIKLLNCPAAAGSRSGETAPCNKCFSCIAIEKGNFPDLMVVRAKDQELEGSCEIKISQIREVQNFLNYKSYYGSFKTVIVDDAENMNQEAQSCFLKTLEEPKGQTVLFLISSKPDMLLSTIFSRCQQIKFFKPKNLPINSEKLEREQVLLKDLLLVIGSNFADKFKYVKSIDFEKQNAGEIVQVLQKYLRHLLMVKIGSEKPETKDANFLKYSIIEIKKAITLSEEISSKLLFTNANPKLALEILLMEL